MYKEKDIYKIEVIKPRNITKEVTAYTINFLNSKFTKWKRAEQKPHIN